MRRKLSILGCGWLGTALGLYLTSKGWLVKGSSASQDGLNRLETTGIDTYYIKVDSGSIDIDYMNFFNTDVLVIALPPKRTDNIRDLYPQQIDQIIRFIRMLNIPRVIFISSTSVYRNTNNLVREPDAGVPDKPVGYALLDAENKLLELEGVQTSVIRFGGLIGANRNPARYLSGKQNVPAEAPVNLIHRKDCVKIIDRLIERDVWGEVFNACSPHHPTKLEFYSKAAEVCNLPPPEFIEGTGSYKIVNSDKLIGKLDYAFEYPNLLNYLKELEEWDPLI